MPTRSVGAASSAPVATLDLTAGLRVDDNGSIRPPSPNPSSSLGRNLAGLKVGGSAQDNLPPVDSESSRLQFIKSLFRVAGAGSDGLTLDEAMTATVDALKRAQGANTGAPIASSATVDPSRASRPALVGPPSDSRLHASTADGHSQVGTSITPSAGIPGAPSSAPAALSTRSGVSADEAEDYEEE